MNKFSSSPLKSLDNKIIFAARIRDSHYIAIGTSRLVEVTDRLS